MTDRDRLAADLHEIACGASARAEWDLCVRDHRHEADRLIGLGWTRLDGPTSQRCSVCGRSDLDQYRDEERLARALHVVHGGGPCFTRYRNCEHNAAAIAKAYREDTDA